MTTFIMHDSLYGFDSKSSQLLLSIGIENFTFENNLTRIETRSAFGLSRSLATGCIVNKLLCVVFPSLIEYLCCFVFQLNNIEILRLLVTFPKLTRRMYLKTTFKSGEKSLIKFQKQETVRC